MSHDRSNSGTGSSRWAWLRSGFDSSNPTPVPAVPANQRRNATAPPEMLSTVPSNYRQQQQAQLNAGQMTAEAQLQRLIKKLPKSAPFDTRISAIKEVGDLLRSSRIHDSILLRQCWENVQDLLVSPPTAKQADAVRAAASLMFALLETHFDQIDMLRHDFFRLIRATTDSAPWKYEALVLLTQEGRVIDPFEKELGHLLLVWLEAKESDLSLLYLAERIFKFNFSLLDEPTKQSLIRQICEISNSATQPQILERCLAIFDVIVTYGTVPSSSLTILLSALCRTVNIESYCKSSWQTMQNLLQGQNCGNQGVRALCSILDDPYSKSYVNLLRGAVFFLSMSVWGRQRISNLEISAVVVLPSLLNVLSTGQSVVAYEVLLAIRRLVKKYGPKLRLEWPLITQIILSLKTFLTDDVDNSMAVIHREVVGSIEELFNKKTFQGDEELAVALLMQFPGYLTEGTVMSLIELKTQEITPINEHWLTSLSQLIAVFFTKDPRKLIRERVLAILRSTVETYNHFYGESILPRTLPALIRAAQSDEDNTIRLKTVDLLVTFAKIIHSTHFNSIIEALNAIVHSTKVDLPAELRRKSAAGLVSTFVHLFPQKRAQLTLFTFDRVIKLVAHPDFDIRRDATACLTKLSATGRYYCKLGDTTSLYLKCYASKRAYIGHLQFPRLWEALVERLRKEERNEMVVTITMCLTDFVRCRSLMWNVELREFVETLCRHLDNRIFGLASGSFPVSDDQRVERHILAFELLAVLIPYAQESNNVELQSSVISAFVSGISGKWTCGEPIAHRLHQTCLSSLLICYTELKEASLLSLAKVLSTLAKMVKASGANRGSKVYVLEHLYAVAKLPGLIEPIISDSGLVKQVFITIMSFTDPNLFSSVYVCFAYQALSVWFLACELRTRPSYFRLLRQLVTENIAKKSLAAEANLDLLSRFTFTDCEPGSSSSEAEFSFIFKESGSQHWTQGNSLITIRTSQLGWALVTVRRATSSVVWMMQLQNKIKTIRRGPEETPPSPQAPHGGPSLEGFEIPEEYLQQFRAVLKSLPGNIPDADLAQSGPEFPLAPNPSPVDSALDITPPPPGSSFSIDLARQTSASQAVSAGKRWLPSGADEESAVDPSHLIEALLWSPTETESPLDEGAVLSMSGQQLDGPSEDLGNFGATATVGSAEIDAHGLHRSPDHPSTFSLLDAAAAVLPDDAHPYKAATKPAAQILAQGATLATPIPTIAPAPQFPGGGDSLNSAGGENYIGGGGSSGDFSPRGSALSALASDSIAMPLSAFYPPLPSYEESDNTQDVVLHKSPSFFPSVDQTIDLDDRTLDVSHGKMSIDAQMYLHGSSQAQQDTFAAATGKKASGSSDDGPRSAGSAPRLSPLGTVQPTLLIPKIRSPEKTPLERKSMKAVSSSPALSTPLDFELDRSSTDSPGPSARSLTKSAKATLSSRFGTQSPGPMASTSASSPSTPTSPPSTSPVLSKRRSLNTRALKRKSYEGGETLLLSAHSGEGLDFADPTLDFPATNSGPASLSGSTLPAGPAGSSSPPIPSLRSPTLSPADLALDFQDLPFIHPSFVFLQLQQIPFFASPPRVLKTTDACERAISVLDKAWCSETHKIGVVFVAEKQTKANQILANSWGSPRFTQFLRQLGDILPLKDTALYTAGLDKFNDSDGPFAIMFKDDVTQTAFHVTTLMPTFDGDPSFTNKLRHIGNDYVLICWCDSPDTNYDFSTIPGEFNSFLILITPMEPGYYLVSTKSKLKFPPGAIGPLSPTGRIVTQAALPHLVRLTAFHANFACRQVMLSEKQITFISNAEERLRQIKTIADRFGEDAGPTSPVSSSKLPND